MRVSEDDLQQLYRSMTARRVRQTDDCLGEELLIRAASNDLTDAERTNVAAHVARCSDCAREYRIARSLRPFEGSFRAAQTARNPGGHVWAAAAAIVLVLMLPALAWLAVVQQRNERTIARLEQQIESQRRQLESARHAPPAAVTITSVIAELVRPQVGVPIIDLDADVTRGVSAASPPIVVPPTSDVFTLILHLPQIARAPLDIELVDANRAMLWHRRVEPDPPSSSITVALNRHVTPAGAYAIDVRSAGSRTTFRFRVEYR